MAFPAKFPLSKPDNLELSPATARLYDLWGNKAEYDNEFYTRFKYIELEGFSDDGYISRRDPSKVLKIEGKFYVYYTCRNTGNELVPVGQDDDTHPSVDWDLADIYVATSRDGFVWNEIGPALGRSLPGKFGCRSLTTPDVLPWDGRYYLYVQVYTDLIRHDACPVGVAVADNPLGPFELQETEVIPQGEPGEWDNTSIHDPYPLIYDGKVYLYYKGAPQSRNEPDSIHLAQGVAIADSPLGPFTKCLTNPVLNSGHETMLWPYREGVAALQIRNGNEGNTVQFAPDGTNFDLKAIVDMPPNAGGPYIPDLTADNRDGRGILWGLSIGRPAYSGVYRSRLLRFDCGLSRDVERPSFKEPKEYSDTQFLAFPLSKEERDFMRRRQK